MEFRPATNTISVKTYSPILNQFETDANSDFTIDYQMTKPFDTIGTVYNTPSGTTPSVVWNGLEDSATYDWYVVISDSVNVIKSQVKTFTFKKNKIVTGSVAGINNQLEGVELFPNPNNGKTITLSYPTEVNARVMITDINGRVVYNDKVLLSKHTVLPVMLDRGNYIINVNASGKTISKQLLVQ